MTRIKRGPSYPVMEHFYSIQGEGFFQGHASYFIRLGGCDVGCVWCDVKESWDATKHPRWPLDDLIETVQASPAKLVIITGGEPLMHDCMELTSALRENGMKVHLETSGAHPVSGTWDWICLSPKKFKPPNPEVLQLANELKIVVYHKSDFEWAEQFAAQVAPSCQLFLQPEWSKEREMTPHILNYIQSHPKWILSLQIHKYLGVR